MGGCVSIASKPTQQSSSAPIKAPQTSAVSQTPTQTQTQPQTQSQPQTQPQSAAAVGSQQQQPAVASSQRQNSLVPPASFSQGAASSTKSRGSSGDSASAQIPPQARSFSFEEIQKATWNFQPEGRLGEGGYGAVFKGCLTDGTEVAVKVLNGSGLQGEREWEAEVRFLSQVNHPNLVRLVGYCSEGQQRDLVYEFMQNGSLDKWLFTSDRKPLTWDVRMRICLDAARGLATLHGAPDGAIIFRDLKASNVLLDSNFNAKLSDFGLAKAGPEGNKSHVSTRVMGTYGYAAPEYVLTGHLTIKSDVYTYGVVLLEIVAGRAALDARLPREEQNLVHWARLFMADKAKFEMIVDRRLKGQFSSKALKRVLILAFNCLRKDTSARPAMADVVKWLESVQGLYQHEQTKLEQARQAQQAQEAQPAQPAQHEQPEQDEQ